jgi:hypothetical protein
VRQDPEFHLKAEDVNKRHDIRYVGAASSAVLSLLSLLDPDRRTC